jgi:Flp pilus assembly protein TadD
MWYLTAVLLLLLASCTERSVPDTIPLQPPSASLSTWKPSLHLADTALSRGAPAMALRITDDLLVRNPRNAEALARRGDALAALDRVSEAAVSYDMAVAIEPNNAQALLGLGRLRLVQDPAAAEGLFARVLTADPHNAVALSDLGVARDVQGHHAAAQEAYRLALGAAPASMAAQVNLGLSLALSGNAEEGVRQLRPLAAAPDAGPLVRQDLALALTLNGRRDEASAMLGRDMRPDQVRGALDAFEALHP